MDTNRRFSIVSGSAAVVAALVAAYALGQGGAQAAPRATTVLAADTTPGVPTPSGHPAITVSGSGKVSGTPDTLALSLGVEVRKPDVAAAMAGANASMTSIVAALKKAGVGEADLQTAGVSVQGDYRYDNDGTSHINGYIATQQLNAKLREAGRAGATIAAAVAAGGDAVRLNGLTVSLDDDSALLVQARERAFAEAKAKAQQYATLAGVTLGAVQSIDDAVVSNNPPINYGRAMDMASAGAAAPPIQLGSQDVAVTVSVVFAIG